MMIRSFSAFYLLFFAICYFPSKMIFETSASINLLVFISEFIVCENRSSVEQNAIHIEQRD